MAATRKEVDLQAFLESAGRSLTDAQGTLGGPINLQADLVIANAELEAKVAITTDAQGRLAVQPISSQELEKSSFNPAGLSTLRVSFVAAAAETPPGTPITKPMRKPADIVAEVREREDVATLQNILGELKIETTFVSQAERWVVTARDPKGRVVREFVLPDAER